MGISYTEELRLKTMNTQIILSEAVIVAFFLVGCATDRDIKTVDETTPYRYSLISPGTKFATLPPAAQNAVRAEAGSAEVSDVVKLDRPGIPVYEISFRNREVLPPLYVAADGSVLNRNLTVAMGAPRDTFGIISSGPVTGVKLAELPPAVSKVISERRPDAQVSFINKETWGDRVVYIVSFLDEAHHPRLYLAADGTVLNEGPK